MKSKVLTLHRCHLELNPIKHLWEVLDEQVWAQEADSHNVRRDKDRNTTGHFRECVGVQVRAAVATWAKQYEAGRHADWLVNRRGKQVGIWLWSWIWKIIKWYWAPDDGNVSCINSVHLCSCKTTEHCQVPVIKRITVTFNYHKTSFIHLEYTVESNTLYTVEY